MVIPTGALASLAGLRLVCVHKCADIRACVNEELVQLRTRLSVACRSYHGPRGNIDSDHLARYIRSYSGISKFISKMSKSLSLD